MKTKVLRMMLVIGILVQVVFATNVPAVTSVAVDYVNNKLTIDGSNFSPTGGLPNVTFAGNSALVLSYTNIEVVVSIPSNLAAGTYDLVMANSVAQNQTTNFSVTIGSSGPGSVSSLTFQQFCAIVPDGWEAFGDPLQIVWGLGASNLSRAAVGCSKLIFVTSQIYTGDLGGYSGANAKCQSAAAAQGFPGKYKAWIDGNTSQTNGAQSPISHPVVEYSTPFGSIYSGRVIAANYAELTSGTLQNSIGQNEFGQSSDAFVWTGLNPDGTEAPGGYQMVSCTDPITQVAWTSSSNSDSTRGGVGRTSYTNSWWTNSGYGPQTCGNANHLYCLQQ